MRTTLLTILALAAILSAQTKPDLGNRSLRGPRVWIMDSNGKAVAADLDKTTLALDPPGTAGGRYTLRAVIPTQAPSALRMRVLLVDYSSSTIILPETPAANTSALVFWETQLVDPAEITLNGNTLTITSTGWQAGDKLKIIYFW